MCKRKIPIAHFLLQKHEEVITITCKYITYAERKRLEQLYAQGAPIATIATTLNVHISTVYRELAKGSTGVLNVNGRIGYDAELAQRATQDSLKRRGGKRDKKKSANEDCPVPENGV